MAEKILVASGKGGVGKSTTVSFLGRALAARGKKVLLIDADSGLGALDIMLNVADKTVNTWLDVIHGSCEPRRAIISVSENLKLIPSPKISPDFVLSNAFAGIIKECEDDFDYIFIDAPAGIDDGLRIAAAPCEKAILIATADEISVRCAAAAVSETEKYGITRENTRLIINRFVKKNAIKSKLLNVDGVIDKSGIQLLGIIPEDKKIPGSSVTQILPDKKSKFIKAVERIAARTEGETVPLII